MATLQALLELNNVLRQTAAQSEEREARSANFRLAQEDRAFRDAQAKEEKALRERQLDMQERQFLSGEARADRNLGLASEQFAQNLALAKENAQSSRALNTRAMDLQEAATTGTLTRQKQALGDQVGTDMLAVAGGLKNLQETYLPTKKKLDASRRTYQAQLAALDRAQATGPASASAATQRNTIISKLSQIDEHEAALDKQKSDLENVAKTATVKLYTLRDPESLTEPVKKGFAALADSISSYTLNPDLVVSTQAYVPPSFATEYSTAKQRAAAARQPAPSASVTTVTVDPEAEFQQLLNSGRAARQPAAAQPDSLELIRANRNAQAAYGL